MLSLGTMAMVLGVQVAISMIVASFLHKLTPYYSFGMWFLTRRLYRWMPPLDNALRSHVVVKGPAKGKHGNSDAIPEDSLLKKNIKLALNSIPLNDLDLKNLTFYSESKWLLDLLTAVLLVSATTLIYYWFSPLALGREMNIAVVWVEYLFLYVIVQLIALTRVYVSLIQERWTCLLMAAFLLISALILLLVDEEILEFDLEYTHSEIIKSLNYLSGTSSLSPLAQLVPLWLFKVCIAAMSTALGTLFVLPCIHFAWMQYQLMSSRSLSTPLRTILRFVYFFPIVCISLWIKPASRLVLKSSYQFTDEGFDLLRIGIVLTYCLLRFCLFSTYIQTHFDKSKKCVGILSESKGSVGELRNQISNPYTLYGCVTLKYIAPIVCLILCTLLLFFSSNCCGLFDGLQTEGAPNLGSALLSGRRIPLIQLSIYRGVFSFLCWWISYSIFVTGLLGSLLQHYLSV